MNRPPSHPRLVLTASGPVRMKPDRSYIAVWGIAGGFAVAAWIVGASALALIAVVCFGSGLCLLITADPSDRCSRHPIAREVEQDREEVAHIVEEWMGRPPLYEAPYDEAELERKIEVAFRLDARERVPGVRAVAAWLAASSTPRGAGRAPGPRRGGSDPAEPARSVGEAASRSDCG